MRRGIAVTVMIGVGTAVLVPAIALMLTLLVTTAFTPWRRDRVGPRDRVLNYAASPLGDYSAIVLERPGGVTVRPSTYLVVLRRTERLEDRVSPLVIKTPYYSYDLTASDLASVGRIDVQWITDDSMVAWIDSRAEVVAGRGDWGGGALLNHGVPDGVRVLVKTRYASEKRRYICSQ